MGTDHIYNVDTFNEMSPSSSDAGYLANCSKAVYDGIRASDPDGIWLMQGWLFQSGFWKAPTVSAYLGGVPNSGMIILDLFTEASPIWSRYDSYYGKPFVWCMLHNFGGRRALGGNLTRIATGPVEDRVAAGSTMDGIGITMEAIEQNPIMYELMLEMAWHKTTVDVNSWVQTYARNRYGFTNAMVTAAWTNLVEAAYQFHYGGAFFGSVHSSPQIPKISIEHFHIEALYPSPREPFVSGYIRRTVEEAEPQLGYDITGITAAWTSLAAAASAVKGDLPGPLSYDLVDVGRQVLVDMHSDLVVQLNAAYIRAVRDKVDSRAEIAAVGTQVLKIIEDLDTLLATDPNYLLGHWISTAKEWATNDGEIRQYEANARYQVTLWGPDGQINDYAEKHWAGLVGDYYHMRWKLLVDTLTEAVAVQKPADAGVYGSTLLKQEQEWCQSNNSFNPMPTGDPVTVTQSMISSWFASETKYTMTADTTITKEDLQFGTAMRTRSIDQLKVLCSINPKCVAFTSTGLLKSASQPQQNATGIDLYVKAQ